MNTIAPVHKKVVVNMAHNDNNNHIDRFINNKSKQTYNNHFSLGFNHCEENHDANSGVGVGSENTLTSLFTGCSVKEISPSARSDLGATTTLMKHNATKKNISHQSTVPSEYSQSAYKKVFNMNEVRNKCNLQPKSSISFVKNASNFSNANNRNTLHTQDNLISYDNVQSKTLMNMMDPIKLGPLIYKNSCVSKNWEHSVYDNPIRSVS